MVKNAESENSFEVAKQYTKIKSTKRAHDAVEL